MRLDTMGHPMATHCPSLGPGVESRVPAWDNPSSSRWRYTRPAYGAVTLSLGAADEPA